MDREGWKGAEKSKKELLNVYLRQLYSKQIISYNIPSALEIAEGILYNGYNETTGGQGNPNAVCKISEKDLLSIYDLLLNSSKSQKEIAEIFSVGQDVISTINNGKSRRLSGYDYPLRDNHKVKNYCIICTTNL